MVFLKSSSKFETDQDQHAVCAGGHVLLRCLRQENGWKIMTATAPELGPASADGKKVCHPMQIIPVALSAFAGSGHEPTVKTDRLGKPYVEFEGIANLGKISAIADMIADKLGLGAITATWMDEVRVLREACAVDDGPAYLMDGISLDEDGTLLHDHS